MFETWHKFMFGFIVVLFLTIITLGIVKESNKPHYKYTVWIGSAVFSVGHDTNSYTIEKGFIVFRDKKGRIHRVPEGNLFEITQ